MCSGKFSLFSLVHYSFTQPSSVIYKGYGLALGSKVKSQVIQLPLGKHKTRASLGVNPCSALQLDLDLVLQSDVIID